MPVEPREKIVSLSHLLTVRQRLRDEGRTVVFTNGCFDLLHVGHVRFLQQARKLGDVLIVGLNSDASVRRLKGPGRPILPEADRAELVAALSCVDYVVVFDEDTPARLIIALQPDIHCKGGDYAPTTGKPLPEGDIVTHHGGRLVFLPLIPGRSTSEIIRAIQRLPRAEEDEPSTS